MTPTAKTLLHKYGLLYISISTLSNERKGSNFKSLEEYDESLGEIAEDEPVILVRVSEIGEHKLSNAEEAGMSVACSDGTPLKNLSILEMPEDEFHFFGAFRKGILELQNELPPFIYGLGQVYAYSLFESYITDVLRDRLSKHPESIGAKKQVSYSEVFKAPSKEALVEALISKEIGDILYLPISGVLDCLRNRFGLRQLANDWDVIIRQIALERNSLIHNNGKVNDTLAEAFPESYERGQVIEFTQSSFENCLNKLKGISVAIDREWEKLA